uniref:Mitochondrial ribosomal protein S17 n=1 Tax=Plectus sambesii TaxID=2011161 RepID=A0A914XPL6_9BILA
MSRFIQKSQVPIDFLMGRVVKLSSVGLDRKSCAQVRVRRNEYNSYLHQFYAKSEDFWAFDGQGGARLGDLVLIRQMTEPLTRKVQHQVERTVFKHGNIVDPITKRRVVQDEFVDESLAKKALIEKVLLGDKKTPAAPEDEQEALGFDEEHEAQLERLHNLRLSDSSPSSSSSR